MYKQNDILVDKKGDERKVLGVCGEVVFLSESEERKVDIVTTSERLPMNGWTLKQEKWKPGINNRYYYIQNNGKVDFYLWEDDCIDLFLLSTGNCHETEADALLYKEALLRWASEKK